MAYIHALEGPHDLKRAGHTRPCRVVRAHALNLARSGCQVVVGSREGSQSGQKAVQEGFKVLPVAQAVGPAIASMLIYLLMATVLALKPQGLFPVRHG